MGVTRGPKYSGPQEGLIFSFDPKNRESWSGGTDLTSIVNSSTMTGSIFNTGTTVGVDGALTTEGYFDFDDTDDYTEIANVGGHLSGSSYCTVEVWMNLRDQATSTGQGIFTIDNPSSGYPVQNRVDCELWSGNLRWNIANNGANYANLNINTWVDEGTWFHYVGTFDGTQVGDDKILLYINGVNRTLTYSGTAPSTLAPFDSFDNFKIGKSQRAGWHVDGKIAIANIWNRTLSAAEVSTQYNRLKGRFGL